MWYNKLFQVVILGVILSSCAARASSENYLSKYQKAISYYQAKNYYKALELFKEVMPMLKGKKEIILAQFYQAYALFYEKSYASSAHCFEEFYRTYLRAEQAEEALYMHGYALYLDSPDLRLDQTKTEKGLKVLLFYLDKYPGGVYQAQAHRYVSLLRDKLALKAFNSTNLYYQLGYYQAVVVEVLNFQEKYPDSPQTEKVLYLKVKSQYQLAETAELTGQLNKWLVFIDYYHEFLDNYSDSKFAKELEKMYTVALEKIDKFVRTNNA